MFFDGEDGEEWPQQDGQDFQLICQFFDPRTGHRLEWVRLFIRNVKDVQDEPGNAFLRHIDLRAQKATGFSTYTLQCEPAYFAKLQVITGWIRTFEIPHDALFAKVREALGKDSDDLAEELTDNILKDLETHGFAKYPKFKVGGVPNTCQGIYYKNSF